MAPSRACHSIILRSFLRPRTINHCSHLRRYSQHLFDAATRPSSKSQIYLSKSSDPYLNLSIEHFLLQKTPPDSTILFLYTNSPCIVIGRNQNPWQEANLDLLKNVRLASHAVEEGERIELVRRRSGGGAVFHDRGNVNYSVICPTTAFDCDKHAEMVSRALRGLGVRQARVNERHDIVLGREDGKQALKVSGSAYKVTRLRSLHHGTCLLSSPNIGNISKYLRSPAKEFLKARGVDSVSSPVANVAVTNADFESAVIAEFQKMYDHTEQAIHVSTDANSIPEINKGFEELRSPQWTYLQTPQFTFSTEKTGDDKRDRPLLPSFLPPDFTASFTARHGVVAEAHMDYEGVEDQKLLSNVMLNKQIHEIDDWATLLGQDRFATAIGRWFHQLFGVGNE